MNQPLRKSHFLFICTANQQRSPTAQDLFAGSERVEARSCGIHSFAEIPISAAAVRWADIIFCMEEIHRDFIVREFSDEARGKKIVVLGIPDIYYRNQPALVALLREELQEWL